MTERVLLTGISGFLGKHIALQLLENGYHVHGTVRNPSRAAEVQGTLSRHGGDLSRLSFSNLDLTEDNGWSEAAAGCRYAIHTASPVVFDPSLNPQSIIGPAVSGTERALVAAFGAGAQRIVVTSSTAAIIYGHSDPARIASEADWTNLASDRTTAYAASKTLAERKAWEIADKAGRIDDLAVINPGAMLGPLLDEHQPTSAAIVRMLLDGKTPAVPRLAFAVVDVRDVAALHVDALTNPDAAGKRCIAAVETLLLSELASRLRAVYPNRRIPRRSLPDWLVRLAGKFNPEIGSVVHELGWPQNVICTTGSERLRRPLVNATDAARAMRDSMLELGILRA